jgi:hypothetical protein
MTEEAGLIRSEHLVCAWVPGTRGAHVAHLHGTDPANHPKSPQNRPFYPQIPKNPKKAAKNLWKPLKTH